MKKIFLFFLSVIVLSACTEESMKVEVSNNTSLEKTGRIVSVLWTNVLDNLNVHEGKSVIVEDADGKQVPCQLIYNGKETPEELIFQVSVSPGQTKTYTIKNGDAENFAPMTYGRAVPERKDDFAWENDRIAFRMYGPALAGENPSNGIDIWLKRTSEMVLDKFYADELERGISYHVDNGQGMDCYKVAHTLGAGGIAPYVDGQLYIGGHYSTARVLDSGVLRTTFELTYDSVPSPGQPYTQKIIISLDAGSQLNKAIVSYDGDFNSIQVAGGIWLHDEIGNMMENPQKGYIAYSENAVSDAGIPSGRNYVGVIFPAGVVETKVQDQHLLAIANYEKGEELTYYFGAGWSKWGFENDSDWYMYIKSFSDNLEQSLSVTIK